MCKQPHPLEVCLRVIPGLNEAVPDGERGGLVALKVVEGHPAAGECVLHVGHNALLDAKHVILLVCVCARQGRGLSGNQSGVSKYHKV